MRAVNIASMLKDRIVQTLRAAAARTELTFPLGEWGRLGNQLFQIAGTYAIASRHDRGVVFRSDWPYRPYFNVPDDWFRSRWVTVRCSSPVSFVEHIPADYRVYFQDLSLWSGREQEIRAFLSPSPAAREAAAARMPSLEKMASATAVHVRRGDYLAADALHCALPVSYYERAIAEIRDADPSTELVVFSDDPGWCRQHLRLGEATFVEGNDDWIDLTLMTRCRHHICANSTFSWWGAFLSEDPRPTVPWTIGLPETLRQIHPPDWHEIEIGD